MKKLSLALIIIGIVLAAIPATGQVYTSYRQQRLLDMLESESEAGYHEDWNNVEESYAGLQGIFSAERRENLSEEPGDGSAGNAFQSVTGFSGQQSEVTENRQDAGGKKPVKVNSAEKKNAKPKKTYKVLGTLKIDKLGVNVPVIEGVSAEDLRIGVGFMPGTTPIGEIGNTAIAGHRSYTFGRYFNRLDELDTGDEIVITTKDNTYTYIVYGKLIVEPDDVSILSRNRQDRRLTLITCHPVYIASHRLIVHARIEETPSEVEPGIIAEEENEAAGIEPEVTE